MIGICGTNCEDCQMYNKKCKGCIRNNACPFGKKCFIASYIEVGGKEKFDIFKTGLIKEINDLNIYGMNKINDLYPLNGAFINLEYTLPNNNKVKLLDDNEIYLANQIECEFDNNKCYGICANTNFIFVCEYEKDCVNPEIIIYKKR